MMGLEEYYAGLKVEGLYLPDDITHTHFRLFFGTDRAMKVKDVIRDGGHLLGILRKWNPTDVFYTPSKFLDPTVLAKASRTISRNLFLYSTEFVIDIDCEDFQESKMSVLRVLAYLHSCRWDPKMVVFSGSKGWHIHLDFPFRSVAASPIKREEDTKKVKSTIVNQIQEDTGVKLDKVTSWDTRRIIRLPGTLHHNGNLVEIVKEEDIAGYVPKHLAEIKKEVTVADYV